MRVCSLLWPFPDWGEAAAYEEESICGVPRVYDGVADERQCGEAPAHRRQERRAVGLRLFRPGEHEYRLLPASVGCVPPSASDCCRPRAVAGLVGVALILLASHQLSQPADTLAGHHVATARMHVGKPLVLAGEHEVVCLRRSSLYEPLDMLGQILSYEQTPFACQERCRRMQDCTGFTYSELDGGCHLADRSSILRVDRLGFSSAPRECQDFGVIDDGLEDQADAFYVTSGSAAATPWKRGANCVPASARAGGTRCCDPAGDTCRSFCGSPPPVSQGEATMRYVGHHEAAGLCARQGMRLCTTSELETNICLGTGCWLDQADVWTSNPCTLEIFKATSIPTATTPTPAPSTQRLRAAATTAPTIASPASTSSSTTTLTTTTFTTTTLTTTLLTTAALTTTALTTTTPAATSAASTAAATTTIAPSTTAFTIGLAATSRAVVGASSTANAAVSTTPTTSPTAANTMPAATSTASTAAASTTAPGTTVTTIGLAAEAPSVANATTAPVTTKHVQEIASPPRTTTPASSPPPQTESAHREGHHTSHAATTTETPTTTSTEASCKLYGCGEFVPSRACQCNSLCTSYRSCCSDYEETCGAQDEPEPVAKRHATYGRWVAAPSHLMGEDCRTVCSSLVGAPCIETAWPGERDAFDRVRWGIKDLYCSDVSEGGASVGYHPSTDGTACRWRGTPLGSDRCLVKAPPEVSRICPCFGTLDLVLDENFGGNTLDRSLWQVEVDCWGGGNHEKQCYRDDPTNVYLENGKLVLRAVRGDYHGRVADCTKDSAEQCTGTQPFTSARIHTYGSPRGSWRYGRVEVRAQMPKGEFLWPAIWMLPVEEAYGQWAASGEIDILEVRGNIPRMAVGSLHFWDQWPNDRYMSGNVTFGRKADLSAGFHNYALEWTADLDTQRPLEMRWSVDDFEFFVQDLRGRLFFPSPLGEMYPPGTPWDQHFFLILNVAVGGNFFNNHGFGEMRTAAHFDAASASWTSSAMVVEHVRVWTQPGVDGPTVV